MSTKKYKGVSYISQLNKYRAKIMIKGLTHFGGDYSTEKEAAKAIDRLCLRLGIPPKNGFYTKKQ